MKILMVGAGIIGSIYGWALAEAGHEVIHFVRKGKAEQWSNGMKLDMLENCKGMKNFIGRCALPVTETLTPQDGFEAVIVPVKPYQLEEVLRQIVPLTGNADYLLLTQNWEGSAAIDAILPQERYLFADARAWGTWQDGVLVATIMNEIYLGQIDGRQGPILHKFSGLFEGLRIKPIVPENILHFIWVQYAINAGLWTGLVRTGGLEKLLSDRINGEASMKSVKECLAVVTARGVDLKKYPETQIYQSTGSPVGMLIAGLMMRLMFRLNKSVQRASAHGLGDPLEIQSAIHNLLETGTQLGLEMPVTRSFELDIERFAASRLQN